MSKPDFPARILVSPSSVSLNVDTRTFTSYAAYLRSNAFTTPGPM